MEKNVSTGVLKRGLAVVAALLIPLFFIGCKTLDHFLLVEVVSTNQVVMPDLKPFIDTNTIPLNAN